MRQAEAIKIFSSIDAGLFVMMLRAGKWNKAQNLEMQRNPRKRKKATPILPVTQQ